ncbi:alpha/beta hydrolase [Natrinema salifodinae]|uniref:Acetyl esterase/lipase n=1 Tax=Natrinema salifodinae TaxID=1202768 RepID=A0A1I0M8W8_9EURY|nr:alpha/beta hydrolase [Natrinema salifodinae]SEV84578.1 Acetyl esterase/lipase [Natrinema salifodinae]
MTDTNRAAVLRRRFLGTTGTIGTLAVAGCSRLNPSDESSTDQSSERDDEETNDDQAPAVSVHEDVTYAVRDAGEMKLDLYVPAVDENPPLVVYVHGGGWVFETRKNAPDLERYAAEWGCATASVSYRLAAVPDDADLPGDGIADNPTPRGVFPNQLVDVKAAIRWLRANANEYGFDPDRVATWGASAGGHLAALAGTLDDIEALPGDAYPDAAVEKDVAPDQSGAVQAVVDWYGVSDLLELPGRPGGLESLLLGGPVSENRDQARRASPTTYVGPETPPFLVMHGREDQVVSIRQSELLFEALKASGVGATMYELHALGHVFGAESERTAMARLTGEPRPAQTVTATARLEEGASTDGLLGSVPPAGPDAIERFLDRALA